MNKPYIQSPADQTTTPDFELLNKVQLIAAIKKEIPGYAQPRGINARPKSELIKTLIQGRKIFNKQEEQ